MNPSLYIKAYDACIVELIGFVCGVVQIVVKMQMFYVFLMVLVLRGNDVAVGQVKPAYDFFYLVQQWPRSYCNTGKVTCVATKITNYFTIQIIQDLNSNTSYFSCVTVQPWPLLYKVEEIISLVEKWTTCSLHSMVHNLL